MRILRLIAPGVAALLLAAVPSPAAAARTPVVNARIVNGHAPTQSWPAQTSVVFTTGSGSFVCGGTLISARWVVTAGHCATDDSGLPLLGGAYALRVGGTTRSNGTPALVDEVVRHPGYDQSGAPIDDVALLHLSTAMAQEPLRLIGTDSAEAALWRPGVQATIIGWGVTDAFEHQSTNLLEAQVPVIGDASCLGVWGAGNFSAASMVCAGGTTVDTCGGDSGGPLMVPRNGAFTIVGVTSWGFDPCGQLGFPGAYARLGAPAINDWVRSLVPTVAFAVSPPAPAPGAQVGLTATIGLGAHAATPAPVLAWDLDDDGAFDDATDTPSASTAFATAGSHVVRVQAKFADGDRAVGRELVTVIDPNAAPPAAPPATPAPAPSAAAPQATPEQIKQLFVQQGTPIGTVAVPARVKRRTLRGRGLHVRFRCERACAISARLTLRPAAARRFGLRTGGGAVTVGRGSGTLESAGSATLYVRLTARARRALRDARHVTIELATELRGDGAAGVQGTQAVTVSR